MARNNSYNGTIDLISGIRPKNGGDFPLVDAHDVQVGEDGARLDEVIGKPFTAADANKLVGIGENGELVPAELLLESKVTTYDATGSEHGMLERIQERCQIVSGDGSWNVSRFVPLPMGGVNRVKLQFNTVTPQWYSYGFFREATMESYIPGENNIYSTGGVVTMPIPEGANYFRVSFKKAGMDNFWVKVTESSVYSEKIGAVEEQVAEFAEKLETAVDIDPVISIYNGLDHSERGWLNGGYLDPQTEIDITTPDGLAEAKLTTVYMPIKRFKEGTVKYSTYTIGSYNCVFFRGMYPEDAMPVDGYYWEAIGGGYHEVSIPSGAKFCRVSFPYVDRRSFECTITTKSELNVQLNEKLTSSLEEVMELDPITKEYNANNGFVPGRLEGGGMINTATGDITYATTDFLPCKSASVPEVVLKIKQANPMWWFAWDFFDADKNEIMNAYGSMSFETHTNYEVKSYYPNPNFLIDAEYVRVSYGTLPGEADPSLGFAVEITTVTRLAAALGGGGGGNVRFSYKEYEGCPHYGAYRFPLLEMTGDTEGMSKNDKKTLSYSYNHRTSLDTAELMEGTATMKWQGSSSIYFPKKNYTINFDKKFNPKIWNTDGIQKDSVGWGSQKKFCLKANYIDASAARNIICAKIWGQMVKSRDHVMPQLQDLPNGGAIDGFPMMLAINGVYQGLYTWNIPKDGWLFGMGLGADTDLEGVICADATGNVSDYRDACLFKHYARIFEDEAGETDFSFEYARDEDNAEWMVTSLNNLIGAVMRGDSLDSLESKLDVESAIDYMLFAPAIGGMDSVVKNYILATYDGVKWFFSAYDMDGTLGNYWSGEYNIRTAGYPMIKDMLQNALFKLIWDNAREKVIARWKKLRKEIFTQDNLATMLYNFQAPIPDAVKRQESMLWPKEPGTLNNDINQMSRWFDMRLKQLDAELGITTESTGGGESSGGGSDVTEMTVAGWGFYKKPDGGIPASDLAPGVIPSVPETPTVPEALKNPYALTFTGAATGTYDGSAPLTIEIPEGGGGGTGGGSYDDNAVWDKIGELEDAVQGAASRETVEEIVNEYTQKSYVGNEYTFADSYVNGRLEWGSLNGGASDFVTTPHVPCAGAVQLLLHLTTFGSYWYAYAFYDSAKNYISDSYVSRTFSESDRDFMITTFPKNAEYFRISVPKVSGADPTNGFSMEVLQYTMLKAATKTAEEAKAQIEGLILMLRDKGVID